MTGIEKTRRFTRGDLVAAVLGLALFAYFLLTVRYSICEPDECSYYLLGHRLALGARMISDEWHLTQFSFLPVVPLYFLYTRITGGTEGIILFMRCAFLCADAVYYAYMYRRLRRFGVMGAVCSFFFCAMFPQTFLGFSYCTISAGAVMAILLILFFDDCRMNAPRLFAVGVLLAVAVLEDPFLVFLFLLWLSFAAVYALRRRSGKPFGTDFSYLLNGRAVLCIVLGCVLVFLVFISFLLLNGAFEEFGTVLPYLLSGSEYNGSNLIQFAKLFASAVYFGPVFTAGLTCALIAAAAVRILKIRSRRVSLGVFCFACLMLAACFAAAAVKILKRGSLDDFAMFTQYHHIPLLLFAPIPFLLDPHPDRKRVCALIAGLLYSVFLDIPSKSFLGGGGFIVRVPLLLQTFDLIRSGSRLPGDAPTEGLKKKARAAALAGIAVCLSAVLLWDLGYVGTEGVYKVPEKLFLHSSQPMDRTLGKGPFKGLKTTRSAELFYNGTLEDMDRLREDPDCAVVILEAASFAYMYLDRPYATFSPIYQGEIDRLSAYWKLPFARRPDYIYLPYYNYYLFLRYDEGMLGRMLANVLGYVDGEVVYGRAGFIIRVRSVL